MKSFSTFLQRVYTPINLLLNKMFSPDRSGVSLVGSGQEYHKNHFSTLGFKKAFLVLLIMVSGSMAWGQRFAVTTGNWSGAIWATTAGGAAGSAATPTSADAVTINGGVNVSVNIITATCASIQVNPTNNNSTGTLTFNTSSILTVIGNVTFTGSGNRNAALNMTSGGTLKVGGSFTVTTPSNFVSFIPGSGTIEYNATGPQTVATTASMNNVGYANLTLSGSGSKTTTVLTVNGILSMEGTATASAVPTYGAAATLQYKGSAAQTTGAEFPATFSGTGGVIINNANGVTLNAASTINTGSKLNLTSGILTTTTANLLSVTNTAATAISAGSIATFIAGPVRWSIGVGTYVFPVGKGLGNYLPFTLVTTAASSPIITLEAFSTDAGAAATVTIPITYISHTEYWQAQLTSGTFTGTVSLTRQSALSGLNIIGKSTSQLGSYTTLGGTPSASSIITSLSITNATLPGFYVMASNQNMVSSVVLGTPQTGAVTYGTAGSVTYNVAITPVGGASVGSTTLSLTGTTLPSGATAAFSTNPVSLPAGSNTVINVTLTITTVSTTPAGTTSGITVSAANTAGTSLSPTVVSGAASFVVTAQPLTVTATGPSKIYGTALTTGTSTTNFSVTGTLASGETLTSVTLTPNAAGLSATTAAGAAYVVTPSAATGTGGFLESNYNITYTPFNGTVTAKALTIAATNSNKTYGVAQSTPVSGSTAFTSSGLVGAQTIGSVTLTYGTGAIAATDAVGSTSIITPSAATGGTFNAGNYTITYNTATLTVVAKVIIVTATSTTKTYGSTQSTPVSGSTDFTASVLANGETIGSVTLTYSAGAIAAADAIGSVSLITPSAATGGTFTIGNYSIVYNAGTLTVIAISQSAADFRSKTTGDFSAASSWEFDQGGGSWVNAVTNGPLSVNSNNVTILSGHTITLDQDYTGGAGKTLLINSGGSLVINELKTLDVAAGGTLDFNGQLVTVKSSSAGTGAIGKILGTLSNATNVTVERYIGTAARAWRLLTIPATDAAKTIRDAWAAGIAPNPAAPAGEVAGNGTLITGPNYTSGAAAAAAGFDYFAGLGSGTSSSIRFYNIANGWGNVNTPVVTTAPTEQGYMLYVRGDRTVATTGGAGFTTTLRPNGTINSGSIPVTVSAAPFVLVGNPYAASINLDDMYNTGANSSVIAPIFYIWDAKLGTSGAYHTLISNAPSPGYTDANAPNSDGVPYLVVNSGQAFFVVPTIGGTLAINESNKTSVAPQTLFRPMGTTGSSVSRLAIKLYQATGTTLEQQMDGTVARFNDIYNVLPTEVYDAAKINNFNENISLVRNNRYLSVESRPYPTKADTLFVPFWNLKIRDYALNITSSQFAGLNQTAVLLDQFTHTQKVIDLNDGTVTYPFSITSDAASSSLGRFLIVFSPSAPLAVSFTKINASLTGLSKVQVSWNTGSETGVKNYEIEKSSDGTSFGKAGTVVAKNTPAGAAYLWLDNAPVNGNNYYRIRSNDENGKYSYSNVAVVQLNAKKGIQVTPTVISNQHFTLSLNDQAAGYYSLLLTNSAGQQVYQKMIKNAGGYNSQEIDLGKTFIAAGVYNLSVSDAKGNKQNFRLIINN